MFANFKILFHIELMSKKAYKQMTVHQLCQAVNSPQVKNLTLLFVKDNMEYQYHTQALPHVSKELVLKSRLLFNNNKP
jgi:hypothetical protein